MNAKSYYTLGHNRINSKVAIIKLSSDTEYKFKLILHVFDDDHCLLNREIKTIYLHTICKSKLNLLNSPFASSC